ncbi:MAG: Zn-dependent hydrolase [Xanthobacteraceae bacterium]|nr:MAG: Zn-dependent hydrolase [Xanthobacteraceae bacterium]
MATLKIAIVPVTPFEQNCSIVWDDDTKKAAIVDPGGDLARIQGAIADLKVIPEKILLTHGHIDHAGGAAELAELLSIPIEGSHEADATLLANLAAQSAWPASVR